MALRTPPGFSLEHGFVENMPGNYEPQGGEDDVPEYGAELHGEMGAILPTSTLPVQEHLQPQIVAIALATYGLSPMLGAALLHTLGCNEEDAHRQCQRSRPGSIDC